MTFVDTLAFQLFSLAFISGLLFYSGIIGYVTYRRHGAERTLEHLQGMAVPLGGMGLIVFCIGLWGEIVWPLPGSYNILFFDPYSLLGIVLLGFAIAVNRSWRTQYVGFLAAMTGLLSMYYGATAYSLSLTKDPLAMFLLYVAMGGTAVFTFPVTLWIDRMVLTPVLESRKARSGTGTPTSDHGAPTPISSITTAQLQVLVGTFLFFLLFAAGSAIAALFIGGGALSSHLVSPP